MVFSGRLRDPLSWWNAFETFAIFCAASSAIYVLNDILDRERDREHPVKRRRPIASGALSVGFASLLGSVLAAAALTGAAFAGPRILACASSIILLNFLYGLWLKHQPVVDVICISLGFVLRMLAGVYAVGEIPTVWITLCTFFLSLFLALAKRRAELAVLGEPRTEQRPVLSHYSVPFLDQAVTGSAVMAILCYALFTATGGKNPAEIVTVPVVVYGIFHYVRRVMILRGAEEPETILLKDARISGAVLLWLVLYVGIQLLDPHLFRVSS